MGAFAQALSSLGGAGNDLSSARQANSTQAFTDQLNALKLRQLQQALGKPDPNDPVSAISLVEKALGRPLTDDEKRMYLGLAPKVAATPAPQRPFNVAPGDAVYDPVTGTVKYTNPAKAASAKQEKPDYATFGGYDWQYDPDRKITGPRDPTGQYVRLGVSKLPKAGDNLSSPELDALARATATGRQLPVTKEGAALATRLESLGLNAPLKVDPRKAASADYTAARKEYEAAEAALQRVPHWWDSGHAIAQQRYDDAKKAMQDKLDTLNQAIATAAAATDAPPDVNPSAFRTY